MVKVALTTVDNPFDPLDDFENWYEYDHEKGYGTCELLDRVAVYSDKVSDDQNNYALEEAIDRIVEFHPTLYKKVKKGTDDNEE